MYSNLFKQVNLPKVLNDVSKAEQSEEKKPPDKSRQKEDEEEKYAELSVKAFFDFMRTAYQVNQSIEDIANTVSSNSEIDWSALAKVSLDMKDASGDTNSKKKDEENCLQKESKTTLTSDADTKTSTTKLESSNIQAELCNNSVLRRKSMNEECAPSISKSSPSILSLENEKKPLLSKVMMRCLCDVLHEGLLDPVLPYMVPKLNSTQPSIRKPSVTDPKKTSSLINITDNKVIGAISANKEREKEKEKNKQKKCMETEVEIHVCDEAKNTKRDFRCPQRLLMQKMGYFATVADGQKLEEMDISVHCDIAIFDWLMRWVKKDIIKKSEWPILDANNVVQIMVSASFLLMEPLIQSCLNYCHENMSEILKTTTILSCLQDNLLTRLADLFTSAEVEILKDRKDKIQSRLFCKLIMALANPKPDNKRGHYASLATLFKCLKCEKMVVRSISNLVPCIPSNMRIDNKGNLHSKHTRDLTWNLNNYIVKLRSELRSWRKVYWRLWGDCHFLFCRQCGVYFPINQMDWCSYHPENPQFFINEHQRTTPFPLGRHPCCSQRAYRFQTITNRDGCKFREHVPEITSERDENIINVFLSFREIISIQAPQLFFPEKITRLVARDSSLLPGKLACKETFWWEGIEIVPPRPKLGLLAKIWGGSTVRKPNHAATQKTSKKVKRQLSQVTNASSVTSSTSVSEEDDGSINSDSSLEEESCESEDSRDWEQTGNSVEKKKKKCGILKRCDGLGSWSSNLTIRYNQDNQRDFEEKVAAQMVALLTKRTLLEYNLRPKSNSFGKFWNSHTQPIGGTYVRLENEFLNQVAQNNKTKTSAPLKTSTRIKSSKQ